MSLAVASIATSTSAAAQLAGRHALVTGSSTGIGETIARQLAAAGATVLISGRDLACAENIASAIRSEGGTATALSVDLAQNPARIREFAETATDALGGRVDILVNNAALYPVTPTEMLTDEDLNAMLAVNVRAPHVLMSQLAPSMVERATGTVVNISSWMSRVGTSHGAMYSATKAALEQLTRSWAAEYGPRGIRVNTVTPGATATPANEAHLDAMGAVIARTAAGRIGQRLDVASAVLWLVSDQASYVHGTTIDVEGGLIATRL